MGVIEQFNRSRSIQFIKTVLKKYGIFRFAKFCMVGAFGTSINMGLLWVLTEFAGLVYLASAAIAIETSILCNYTVHTFFTFSDHRPATIKAFFFRMLKYNMVSLMGMAINMAILWFFTEIVGLYYLLSNIIGIISVTVWRYFISKRWIWKSNK